MTLDSKAFEAAKHTFHKTYVTPDGPLRGAIEAYLAATKNHTMGIDIPRLPVGTPVTKVLGYPFPGTVVSTFHTLSGQERFVVEATGEAYHGMLHIFNGDQLRATTPPQTTEVGKCSSS